MKILKHYNLIVPEDQTIKDITVQVLINQSMDFNLGNGLGYEEEMLEAKTPK